MKGIETPSSPLCFSALPRENPLLRKTHPTPIPAMNPTRAIKALRSPPPSLITILRGHPRNTRAPSITINPMMNLKSGEDPPRGRKSPRRTLKAKEPRMIPMISGLTYSTIGAVWRCMAPAVSRRKQAMQNPMFPGFPKTVNTTAATPIMTPVIASFPFSFTTIVQNHTIIL